MDDSIIIELLFDRNEAALDEISYKYSDLYKSIIGRVLSDKGDIEECANDVLLTLWRTIPPTRPRSLPAYICSIARRIGIDRLRHNTSARRNPAYTVTLSELGDCLPSNEPTDNTDSETIRRVISNFLQTLDAESEILFLRRYVYLESISELAKRFKISENHVSVKLYRARRDLKKLLESEGISI